MVKIRNIFSAADGLCPLRGGAAAAPAARARDRRRHGGVPGVRGGGGGHVPVSATLPYSDNYHRTRKKNLDGLLCRSLEKEVLPLLDDVMNAFVNAVRVRFFLYFFHVS